MILKQKAWNVIEGFKALNQEDGKWYLRSDVELAVKELKEERWCIYTSHDREGCACLPGKHHYVIDERDIDEKFGCVGKE